MGEADQGPLTSEAGLCLNICTASPPLKCLRPRPVGGAIQIYGDYRLIDIFNNCYYYYHNICTS